MEALVRGLAIKALWQIRALGSSGRRPILFFDEPGLSGYGSAFLSMDRVTVLKIYRILMDYIRGHSDALIGIHCCGNTDWSMLLEADPDIINVDAFDYMEPFLLYREDIIRFLDRGGHIAWGIVPTSRMTEEESVEGLWARLEEGLSRMEAWGLEAEDLARRSLLTPACGMGSMTPELASKACSLLDSLSEACHRFWVR